MALVEIKKITIHQPEPQNISFELSSPEPVYKEDVYSIKFAGWVRSQKSNFKSLTVRDPISRIFCTYSMRDTGSEQKIKKILLGKNQDFNFLVGVIGFPLKFTLVLSGTLEDNSVVRLATIEGVRQPARSAFHPTLQPLILNSLGRTGTTLLMRLLSAHSHIVAQKIHPYEVRAASYWIQFFRILSSPYSGSQQDIQNVLLQQSSIGSNVNNNSRYIKEPQVKNWIGMRYVENMASFCQQSIEEYYLSVAESQNDIGSSYFIEKYYPSHIPLIIWELYPKAREIILVRDFRDMLSSINAFNAKRGDVGFGRKRVLNDEDYVESLGQKGIRNLHRAWVTRQEKVHLVRYEDVVLKPMDTVRAMLQYLGLEHSDSTIHAMLSAVTVIENEEEQAKIKAHKTSNSPEESIGRWRKDLSPSLQALCKREFGHILDDFGYTD